MTWKPKTADERAWLRGIEVVLSLVAEWDHYVVHDYRLSDCLRSKLNLTNKKPRRNLPPTMGLR